MEDLIERARAIEIIHELQDSQTWDQTADMAYDLVDWAISEIPSAQADSKELSFTHKALDTISRQAALDWLKNEWNGMVTSLFDGIKALPSAQPEPCEDAVSRAEIIRLILERGLYCDTQADRETSAEIIRQLPSAEPEPEPVGCSGCRYERFGNRVCDACSRFYVDRYEAERRTDG